MKHRVGLGLTLAVCAAVEAAEPLSTAPLAAPADAAIPAPAPATPLATKPTTMPAKPVAKSLNLRIGDVRSYMLPDEYSEVLGAPDADSNTVIVEGKREMLPMKSEQPVPGGLIAPFWALAHPLQSWRIFLPDVAHAPKDGPREPEDKVPPPIFRWGP